MDLSTNLPTMTDDELANLRQNGLRLIDSGTAAQKAAAAALMPSIEAELGVRLAAKTVRRNEALAIRRAARVKPAASPPSDGERSEASQA